MQFIFEVRGLDGDQSEIALKRRKVIADIEGWEEKMRAAAERCGRRV